MPLRAARLGPYEILSPLGSGGMGEVYRARDSRLGREVALKVLPEDLAAHPERLQRFEREARAVSALNHPNIVVLHDVGREEGVNFLVMELVEGRTLADRLASGPLPLDLVIRLGRQIGSALEACHQKGLIHRDLKPSNIMLTSAGVKLLDFGLARALDAEPRNESESSSSERTASAPLTRAGVVVGTLPYMAPEQLHGGPIDARSDLFALGAVLYECATGRRAFEGDTGSAVARAVLSLDPPPASSFAPVCPRSLDRLIQLCLEKDPELRYRSAHDVALQLGVVEEELTSQTSRESRSRPRVHSWLEGALAIVSAVLLALVIRGAGPAAPPPGGAVRFEVFPPPGGRFVSHVEGPLLAVSPDGSRIAFVASDQDGVTGIWVRRLDSLGLEPIAGTEGAWSLFWSPDGRSIGFFTAEQLKRVDVEASRATAPVTIATLGPGGGRTGTWGADAILYSSILGEAILRVSPDGGVPEVVLEPDPSRGETRTSWPWFLEDGESFLYFSKKDDRRTHLELRRKGEGSREIALIGSQAQFVPPHFLVYVTEGVLVAQRLDLGNARLDGSPYPIAPIVRYFQSNGWAGFATSPSGTLAYRSETDVMHLAWFDRTGNEVGKLGNPGEYLSLALSKDGSRLLFDRIREGLGTWDVWSLDIARGIETRITSSPDSEAGPVWLPSEKGLIYYDVETGLPQLVRRDIGSDNDEHLLSRPGFHTPKDVSPDGRTLLFSERNAAGHQLWTMSLAPSDGASPTATPFPVSIKDPLTARFSPDGRWVALVSSESGRFEGYVTTSDGKGGKIQVSKDGTTLLRWGRDGHELLYVALDGRVISVPVSTDDELHLGKESVLFRLPKNDWKTFEVAPDGRLLAVVIESSGDERPATVVLNWPSLLPR